LGPLLMTLDTVWRDTSASRATSSIVTACRRFTHHPLSLAPLSADASLREARRQRKKIGNDHKLWL